MAPRGFLKRVITHYDSNLIFTMMHKYLYCLLGLAAVCSLSGGTAANFGAASAFAASADAPITISLDSCRSMAVHNNKAIKIAEEAVKGAGYDRKAAFAAYLPGIDFSALYLHNQHKVNLLGEDAKLPTMTFNPLTQSFDYNVLIGPDLKPVLNPETGQPIPTEVAVIPKEAMSFDMRNIFAGGFTLTQPIFMGGQIRALNQITKYAEELARTMRNSAVQDVVYAVDEAYWQVVSLGQKKVLADSYVQLVDSLYQNVEALQRNGMATRSDVLTVQVKKNEAEIAATKVRNGLTLSRMALAQICGLPIDANLQLEDEQLDRTPSFAPELTYNMEDVYASRQDLASLRHGISIFKQKEKVALGEMLPKLAAIGMWEFSNPNVQNGFQKKFGNGFHVGATLTVPIWHWGQNYNGLRSAKSATKRQEMLLEDAEEKVELQVKQARFSFDEAYKTYDMTVNNMRKADENLRQAQLGFHEGVLTADDVIAAQTAWIQAHSEKIDAQIGVQLCNAYLSKVLGTMNY